MVDYVSLSSDLILEDRHDVVGPLHEFVLREGTLVELAFRQLAAILPAQVLVHIAVKCEDILGAFRLVFEVDFVLRSVFRERLHLVRVDFKAPWVRIVSNRWHRSLFEALRLPVKYDRITALCSKVSWLLWHRCDTRKVSHVHVKVIIGACNCNWILDEPH